MCHAPRLPLDVRDGLRMRVALDARHAAVVHVDHAVGDGRDSGVVRDDDDGGAAFAAHILQDLQDLFAGVVVERARGLVAEQDFGVFRNGAGDGHALLLAAGKLCREVIDAVGEADHLEDLHRVHGVLHDLARELDVFLGGQVLHQVIELKDEPHVVATVLRYVKDDYALIAALTGNGTNMELRERVQEIIGELLEQSARRHGLTLSYGGVPADYGRAMVLSGITSVIWLWIKKGCVEPPEEISRIVWTNKSCSPQELLE